MAAESDVLSEIEVLQSIYLDELLVSRREDGQWEVSLDLYPSTAEDSVSQFVRLTLTLTLDQQYPTSSPAISIHNPRGLSDDKLSSVQKCLQLEAQSCLGSPVLYQLIEKAKEILTESNIPHGNCVICLYGFKEGEVFTKTSCYHYFHSHCLGRYASHSESELRQREKELEEDKTRERGDQQELMVVCPVCREPLVYDADQLLSSPAPQLPELDEAAIGSDFQQKWCELQKLLERQRSKGGIIDPEVESNRFLIHINEAPSPDQDIDVCPNAPAPSASHAYTDETAVRAGQSAPGPWPCRGGQGPRHHSQAKAQKRGSRNRQQHGRAAPVTEHLDKLRLSSDCPEGQIKTIPKRQQMHGSAEFSNSATNGPIEPPEAQGFLDETSCQPGLEMEFLKNTVGGRGDRGRRRGPPRLGHHLGAPGSARCHWDGRGPRSRGGGVNPHSGRGRGRGGGGPHQGHGRGFQQRVVERGREEVL